MTTKLERIRARSRDGDKFIVVRNGQQPVSYVDVSRYEVDLLLVVAEAAAELSPGEWQTIRIALQKMRFTPDRVLAALDHIDAAIAPLMEETE